VADIMAHGAYSHKALQFLNALVIIVVPDFMAIQFLVRTTDLANIPSVLKDLLTMFVPS